jgi:hypothetical protein
MKNKPLFITIPNPCNESFSAMQEEEGGKHCDKCNHIVYDFSQMTDIELIRFFKAQKTIHCGRFHTSQLDREIKKITIPNYFYAKFAKVAASILTLLTFRGFTAKGTQTTSPSFFLQESKRSQSKNYLLNENTIIKGIVKDENGNVLEKVAVYFDGKQVALTDVNGQYSFSIDALKNEATLYFSLDSFDTIVRNYHMAMGSTSFNVVLYKHVSESEYRSHTAGVISQPNFEDLPVLEFKNSTTTKLSNENKAILLTLADKLKQNPYSAIEIRGFVNVCSTPQKTKLINARIDIITKYLIEKQGISTDRITKQIEAGEFSNSIDIKSN